MSNAMDFINAYSKIEKYFSTHNKSGKYYSFSNSVNFYAKRNSIIKKYHDDLLEYAQLRNAIVHDRVEGAQIIAEPHEEVVKNIEYIARLLTDPPTLRDYQFNKLLVCHIDDSFSSVLNKMNDMGYSQVPVIENNQLVNLLSPSMIVHHMYKNVSNESINLTGVTIRDVLENEKQHYKIVSIDDSIVDIIEMFTVSEDKGQATSVLVVVDPLSNKKKPVGLLTLKDLPKLLNILAKD